MVSNRPAPGSRDDAALKLEDIPFSAIFKRMVKKITVDIAAHVGLSDPHTQYVLEAATPGGELGNTYASPTVDALHSGSTHAATQAAAEATAAAALAAHTGDTDDAHDASAISILDTAADFTATNVEDALAELQSDNEAHVAAADPHPGYRLESVAIAAADVAADVATQAELDAHINDTTAAHAASAISIADAGGDFTATDVEGALDELQADAEADATALQNPHHTVRAGAGAPSGAPTGTELPIAVDTTAVTGGVYYWTGAAWVLAASI